MGKISALTITLIVLILMSLFTYYSATTVYNEFADGCNKNKEDMMNYEVKDKDGMIISDMYFQTWQTCIISRGDLLSNKQISGFSIIVFVFLAILSWKVDRLKK